MKLQIQMVRFAFDLKLKPLNLSSLLTIDSNIEAHVFDPFTNDL